MQDRGEISDLEVQVPYECVVEGKKICKYFADFRYRCGEDVIVEDTKGVITQVFTLKKKLVEALYPGLVIQIIVDPREQPRTEYYLRHYLNLCDLPIKLIPRYSNISFILTKS